MEAEGQGIDSRLQWHRLGSGGYLPRPCVPRRALGERITSGSTQVKGHLQTCTCWMEWKGLAAADRPPLGRHVLDVTGSLGMREVIEAALALRRATGIGSVREILIEVREVVVLEEEGRVIGKRPGSEERRVAGDLQWFLNGCGRGTGVPGED